jgi:hypothetical protein
MRALPAAPTQTAHGQPGWHCFTSYLRRHVAATQLLETRRDRFAFGVGRASNSPS